MLAPATPRKRRKEARPTELTAAALALFVEKGFSATRLEDVASRAGVSKGTLYLYFDSKEALFKAVIQEGILPVVVENEAIAAKHTGSSFDLLEKLLDNWWGKIGLTDFAGIPKLMVAEARNFPEVARFYYENVICRGRALVGAALERGMATGEFRRMEVETTIDVVIAPILMLLIWRFSMACCQNGESDSRLYLQIHMNILRQGLRGSALESRV
ncbi:MAG: TetR/AcrR family transcriptional regulator [Betaproteobacteria bacterium]|jgi:AcrR family transcriptional regulator|nr:TetR/AcrR family transcriptional regulator [Betaproteobacteria bacterium]MBK8320048.1 TetR/AcrR family transcriptional regulator [Betaproteobacteria bacterium]MBK9786188.1 TetR/AcrR family transcriptional regulator [Candidatus Dechloromonas phosphorivorans]MBP8169961.1 TetR/AcrR family transcriptional regulator [Azonexus sp.]